MNIKERRGGPDSWGRADDKIIFKGKNGCRERIKGADKLKPVRGDRPSHNLNANQFLVNRRSTVRLAGQPLFPLPARRFFSPRRRFRDFVCCSHSNGRNPTLRGCLFWICILEFQSWSRGGKIAIKIPWGILVWNRVLGSSVSSIIQDWNAWNIRLDLVSAISAILQAAKGKHLWERAAVCIHW